MPGILTITRMYWLPEAVHEGSIDYDQVRQVDEEFYLNASDTAAKITSEGLTFYSTGTTWAGSPDGSHTTNYATGEECETTAHLSGFHPRVETAIMNKVG